MYDYGTFAFETKAQVLDRAKTFWNPDKTQFWTDSGVDLVIDRREAYFLWDMGGRRLIDMHLNGGTYNLGHRNPEVMQAISEGMTHFDVGNHHFPSVARTALAQRLIESAPASLKKVAFGSGGGEAIDIALKSARHATKRRKIVSIVKAYHGHTGLAVATGDDRFAKMFLADQPDEFIQVPFGDVAAMEQALAGNDVAAVIMETIPATYGFPLPPPGYLEAVKGITEKYGALYIADEVQTGLMRTGEMWAITKHGIEPDIMVTGKACPAACIRSPRRCSAIGPRSGSTRTASVTSPPSAAPNWAVWPPSRPWRSAVAPRCGRWSTTFPTSSTRGCGASRPTTRTGLSASGRTAW